MSQQRDHLLKEIGLGPVWKLREAAPEPASAVYEAPTETQTTPAHIVAEAVAAVTSSLTAPVTQVLSAPVTDAAIAQMDWPQLESAVSACQTCVLCKARKQAVLGVGDVQADWLFVGEGPGAEEDERGEPFVGQAGKLLDAMLGAINLKRGENVYIANAVKCRPPNNRTPEPDEIAACRPYLERQIDLIQPKVIVALGRPAAQTLLQREIKIGASRGQLHDYKGIPVIITYHPAYLLRNLHDKASAWEDLCFARKTMG